MRGKKSASMNSCKRNIRVHLLGALCLALSAGARAADSTPVDQDTDCDGIPDTVEQDLLEKYRPWLYYDAGLTFLPFFDVGETFWPCSATWFVQHSRLIHSPI